MSVSSPEEAAGPQYRSQGCGTGTPVRTSAPVCRGTRKSTRSGIPESRMINKRGCDGKVTGAGGCVVCVSESHIQDCLAVLCSYSVMLHPSVRSPSASRLRPLLDLLRCRRPEGGACPAAAGVVKPNSCCTGYRTLKRAPGRCAAIGRR